MGQILSSSRIINGIDSFPWFLWLWREQIRESQNTTVQRNSIKHEGINVSSSFINTTIIRSIKEGHEFVPLWNVIRAISRLPLVEKEKLFIPSSSILEKLIELYMFFHHDQTCKTEQWMDFLYKHPFQVAPGSFTTHRTRRKPYNNGQALVDPRSFFCE